MAEVLEHPRVKLSLAESVTNGMNHSMEQPDLGFRLQQVSESMREHNLQTSRSIGEQLLTLTANFVEGVMSWLVSKKKRCKRNDSSSSEREGRFAFEVGEINLSLNFLGITLYD